MLVHFRKIARRRYALLAEPEGAPAVIAHPAPGYDDDLPHDLLQFVAEAEWGLDGAVFGQLAAGQDPGIFLPVEHELVPRWVRRRRLRRKTHPKGRRSEVLAHVLECAWNARRRKVSLPDNWDDLLASARVEPEHLARVVDSLDELAKRWHPLPIGAEFCLTWPRPGRRRTTRHQERRGRTSSAPRPLEFALLDRELISELRLVLSHLLDEALGPSSSA